MRRRVAVELVLLALIVVALNYLSARHYWRGDWTSGRSFTLSPKTEQLVRALDREVNVIVFMMPSGDYANDLYSDVRELCERARRLSDKLHVEYVDIDRERERAKLLGRKYAVGEDDLRDGVVVVASGDQSKFITRADLADWDFTTEPAHPTMKAWKGEQAFAAALLSVTEERAPNVCFVTGHGERGSDDFTPGGYGDFAEELKRDHQNTRAVSLDKGLPRDCDLTVLAGPEQPLSAPEVAELEKLLERGGRLLVLLGPTFDARALRFVDVGVEDLLDRWGASVRNDVVVDEAGARGAWASFAVLEGYADHPITRQLMHHRTLWSGAREVRATPKLGLDAREIVHASEDSWAKTDLAAVFSADAQPRFDAKRDVKGPIPLAVAVERTEGTGKGARLVVLGSAELAAGRQVLGYNRDLLLSAIAWLETRPPKIAIGPRSIEHLRLELDDRQLSRVFLLCVIGLPLLALLVGGGVFWVRRS
jgi:ABC-type uncharacterized transport system involved in gliding motility auxiliary subunit